jgi:hypothetical protein
MRFPSIAAARHTGADGVAAEAATRGLSAERRTFSAADPFIEQGARQVRSLDLGRYALCSCAAALLAGCGGSQPLIGAPGAMPQSSAIATHAERVGSWMLPEAASQDLLYVSNIDYVTEYSYPQGILEGKLKHFYFAEGQCVDQNGDVFIANYGDGGVDEYAHAGTKRIRTLSAVGPFDCSIDPTTGNLAATQTGPSHGGIAIFKNARGTPTYYTNSSFWEYDSCSYDAAGNLFVDGMNKYAKFIFAELPKGSSQLKVIALNQYIGSPAAVRWDGKYVAIGDSSTPVIYQFVISGSSGTRVGATRLGGSAQYISHFFIEGGTLITPNFPKQGGQYVILFFKYPAGGNVTKEIRKDVSGTTGTSVSLAPR